MDPRRDLARLNVRLRRLISEEGSTEILQACLPSPVASPTAELTDDSLEVYKVDLLEDLTQFLSTLPYREVVRAEPHLEHHPTRMYVVFIASPVEDEPVYDHTQILETVTSEVSERTQRIAEVLNNPTTRDRERRSVVMSKN